MGDVVSSPGRSAVEALASAMDGCEDGYSRRGHYEVVASVLAALEADGFCVAPLDPDSKMQMVGGATAQGLGIDDESPVVLAYHTYRAMLAARPK